MTPAERLLHLFDYDHWANIMIGSTFEEHPSFGRRDEAMKLFAHITATPAHWLERIDEDSSTELEVWPTRELVACIGQADKNHRRIRLLIEENSENLDRLISYTNSSGRAFDSLLSDILHHLVIHGQHHRAQIAQLLRMDDIVPPQTDFIAFTRTGG